jgi:hypothetical protein
VDRVRRDEGGDVTAQHHDPTADFYRRHEHLSRTELYHRARTAGVEGAALLSKAELIHALAAVGSVPATSAA